MRDEASLAGLRLLERYRLEHVLATGGLSVVYRGKDDALNRPVVVKVVPQRHIARFRDALRATGALTHPAMVVVLDAFDLEDRLFVVQEFVEGPSVEGELRAGLDVMRALQLELHIAQCVAYAHEHQVIHGDLSPTAILLDRERAARINNFRLPADPAYLDATRRASAIVARGLGLPAAAEPDDEQEDGVIADVRAVGMLLWQALAMPVHAGERQDFRPDVTMDVRRLVARLLVRGHPDAVDTAAAAAEDIAAEVRKIESARAEDEPTPALLHAVRLKREKGARAPWAEAETLVDQPALGPSLAPPPPGPRSQPRFGASQPGLPPYVTPGPDYDTIPSRPPPVAAPSAPLARAPSTSAPLRTPTSSAPLRAPNPTSGLGQRAHPSQPGGYRPPSPLPWVDEPQVAQWIAGAQSRPHGRAAPTGGLALPKRRGVRVAPLVLIGIMLFILAFVLGYFGPPLLLPH